LRPAKPELTRRGVPDKGDNFLNKQKIANTLQKKSGAFYGYSVLFACFLIITLVYGAQASFGVFFKPMLNEFHWTRTATSIPFSLNLILSGVFAIFAGRISDRIGPKAVVAIGGVILGAGYILMSRITNLPGLYVSYGLVVALGSSTMYVPLVAMITRWFPEKRGLMVGIAVSGIGFGIGVVPTIASRLMVSFDWRSSLLIIGVASLVLIAGLAQLLKTSPLAPVSASSGERQHQTTAPAAGAGLPFNEALKTSQFWLIFVAWLLYGFFYQVSSVHLIPYATDLGMPELAAATLLTVIGIIGIIGRAGLGFIGDKINNNITLAIGFIAVAAVFFIIAASATVPALYIYAIVYGFFSGVGVLLASINAEHFGLQSLGAITGAIILGNNIGGAAGPILAGHIFDVTGSYRPAFLLCGATGIAAGIVIWLVKPAAKHQR
jgi:MFS family permease